MCQDILSICRVFIIFASAWILQYILGYWIYRIFEMGYFTSWVIGYSGSNNKILISWARNLFQRCKDAKIVQEVKRTFHSTFFHVSISSSPYLIKGEDWWGVILYHFWLRSKLIMRYKNSKGPKCHTKINSMDCFYQK